MHGSSVNLTLHSHQLGLISLLPSEIFSQIVSRLSQQDCLACMAVCRTWYFLMPQYTQEVWKVVRFNPRDARFSNLRREHCLGDHVETIIFDTFEQEDYLYHMMGTVARCGCTSATSLVFKACSTIDQDAFLQSLKQFGSQLRCLEMMNHRSNVSFIHLFSVCPNLNHFTFNSSCDNAYTKYDIYNSEPSVHNLKVHPSQTFNNIVYLNLDFVANYNSRVEPILQRCPNIQCLVGPSYNTASTVLNKALSHNFYTASANSKFKLNSVFTHCPHLSTLVGNSSYCYHPREDIPIICNEQPQLQQGLRTLFICEDDDYNSYMHIAPHISRNQDTLEHLSIQLGTDEMDEGAEWSPLFRSIQLKNLRVLKLQSLKLDTESFVTMLNQCPVIETIGIEAMYSFTFDQNSVRRLQTIPSLQYLDFEDTKFDDNASLIRMLNQFPSLKRLSLSCSNTAVLNLFDVLQYLPQLQHLYVFALRELSYDTHGENDCVSLRNSKLKTISLIHDPGLSPVLLLSMARIPTLEDFTITVDPTTCSESILNEFTNLLRHTSIKKLDLSDVGSISYHTFDILGDLPLLSTIIVSSDTKISLPGSLRNTNPLAAIYRPIRVDKPGFLSMLQKSTSLMQIHFKVARFFEGNIVSKFDELESIIAHEMPWYKLQAHHGPNDTIYYLSIERTVA